jgi:selenoprotein W-related protein
LLLEELKQGIRTLELEPGKGGCFEVYVDGKRIYSKLETGAFPEPESILAQVSALAR